MDVGGKEVSCSVVHWKSLPYKQSLALSSETEVTVEDGYVCMVFSRGWG